MMEPHDWVVTIEGAGPEPDGEQLLALLSTAQRVTITKGQTIIHELAQPDRRDKEPS